MAKKIKPLATRQDIAAKILSRRTELGKTQKDIYTAAGMTEAGYIRIEQGAQNPSIETLLKIWHALEIDISAIV